MSYLKRSLLVGLGVLVSSTGVAAGCDTEPPPRAAAASPCPSLCRTLAERCPSLDRRRCHEGCEAWAQARQNTGCERAISSYLACVEQRPPACDGPGELPSRLGQSGLAPGCRGEQAALERCLAPCLGTGTRSVGNRELKLNGVTRSVRSSSERAGCDGCPPETGSGAGAGAACEAAAVCVETCCRCPGKGWFLARACVDGRCAAGPSACEAARQAAPRDPCGG